MARLRFNADLGEGCGQDALLMPWLDDVNIACAAHAGDEHSMARAVELALEHGCRLGAHPGYADREHFGRRPLQLSQAALKRQLEPQLERLAREVERVGGRLEYVKPHGALYNQCVEEETLAGDVLNLIQAFDSALAVMTLPGGALEHQALKRNMTVIREGFADRAYDSQGRLLPRTHPHALITDLQQAAEQAHYLHQNQGVQSLCVHGDNPQALKFVQGLRERLLKDLP